LLAAPVFNAFNARRCAVLCMREVQLLWRATVRDTDRRYHEPALSPLGHLLSERHKLVLASDLNRAILSHQVTLVVTRRRRAQTCSVTLRSALCRHGL
jgi:hypothetical protein